MKGVGRINESHQGQDQLNAITNRTDQVAVFIFCINVSCKYLKKHYDSHKCIKGPNKSRDTYSHRIPPVSANLGFNGPGFKGIAVKSLRG